jgi:hypothetical protein
MVPATDMGKRYNISHLGGFYSTGFRRILIQRYVRSASMIITEVLAKDSTQVSLIENNNMIQAVSAYGPDNSFNERVLPRRARGRNNLLDTQALDPSSNLLTVNGIPITQHTRGAESNGNASTNCWAVHRAVGCAVTLKCTMWRSGL